MTLPLLPFIGTTLFIVLHTVFYLWELGAYVLDSAPPIVLNLDQFYNVFKDVLGIVLGIGLFYLILHISNLYVREVDQDFRYQNRNIIATKTHPFLWIQLYRTSYHMHDFATGMLLFIGWVQYMLLHRKINLINYFLLSSYAHIQSGLQWFGERSSHAQNKKKSLIIRNKQLQSVTNSSIRTGDILYLRRNNSIRVKEGIVLDQDLVALNLGQTGERTIEEYKIGSKVLEGLVVKNHELVKIEVSRTFSDDKMREDNIHTVKDIMHRSTTFAIYTIFGITSLIAYIKGKTVIDVVDFLLDLIGCFIGLNYLIPSFKIQQSLNLWDSVYKYISRNHHYFTVCNHGNVDQQFTPENTVILSDKTGTLTNNVLTIQRYYLDPQFMDLIVGHMNSIFDDDHKHTSHSPETNVISDFLYELHGIKVDQHHKWTDRIQVIDYIQDRQSKQCIRHQKRTYRDSNLGSHSLIQSGDLYYHVFMGSKALLSERLEYREQVSSTKRGLLLGMIPLEDPQEFEDSLARFRDRSQVINNYRIISEFHFHNHYRVKESQQTRNGIDGLIQLGFSVYVITGDSLITAKDIGLELGIIGEDGTVVDGTRHIKETSEEEQDRIIREVIEKRCAVFGNTRAAYKQNIVEQFQKHKRVIFLGDQENDYFALQRADLSIVQESGNNKCKQIAHLIGEVPTETAFQYLSRFRRLGIEGKCWFYNELVRFNYLTAAIWLVGIYSLGYKKVNLLFLDPWTPLASFIMTIFITVLCLFRSFRIRPPVFTSNRIIYGTPIYSLLIGTAVGIVMYLLPISYTNVSIWIISALMTFL